MIHENINLLYYKNIKTKHLTPYSKLTSFKNFCNSMSNFILLEYSRIHDLPLNSIHVGADEFIPLMLYTFIKTLPLD